MVFVKVFVEQSLRRLHHAVVGFPLSFLTRVIQFNIELCIYTYTINIWNFFKPEEARAADENDLTSPLYNWKYNCSSQDDILCACGGIYSYVWLHRRTWTTQHVRRREGKCVRAQSSITQNCTVAIYPVMNCNESPPAWGGEYAPAAPGSPSCHQTDHSITGMNSACVKPIFCG